MLFSPFLLPELEGSLWISDKDNSIAKNTVPQNDALCYCSSCSFVSPGGTKSYT